MPIPRDKRVHNEEGDFARDAVWAVCVAGAVVFAFHTLAVARFDALALTCTFEHTFKVKCLARRFTLFNR